jgi:hypothetical protein
MEELGCDGVQVKIAIRSPCHQLEFAIVDAVIEGAARAPQKLLNASAILVSMEGVDWVVRTGLSV